MTKHKKRIARLKQVKGEVPFKTVKIILEDNGYCLDRVKGSHFHFTSDSKPLLTIAVHNGFVKKSHLNFILKCLKI